LTEPVELLPYDPNWPAAFESERTLIAPILGTNAIRIEHMGSTSIPGLPAKPIIDVIVLVDDLDAARSAIPALEATGYSFWADNPDKTKLFLVRGLPPAPHRTHHLHIYDNPDEVDRHLVFRDRLRADPELRDGYLTLKIDLAARFRDDREAYTNHKAAFINTVVRPAR
jgi:GrpB-like predicted nucleotidyltransferase (UPF0157 family)